ncbi:bZIP transcription factor hapX [Exophiala dermatitidis]
MASTAGSPPAATTPATSVDVKPILSRKPSLCMKPVQEAPAPSPSSASPPLSLTSKEWVIPPRPKPGRKPATDTPPTKRKAQNRAAQRAFRERRAARVGELEEQLKQIEEENEQEQQALKNTIQKLETELDQYRADLSNWVERCRKLESELASLKALRPTLGKSGDNTPSQEKQSPTAAPDVSDNSVGCGNCTLETRCQCIDDAFTAMGGEAAAAGTHQHEKRPHSPQPLEGEKRVKVEPSDSLEIDFTTVCASKSLPSITRVDDRSPTTTVADPCGFCSDGTPCICAEMAAEQEIQQQEQQREQSSRMLATSRPAAAGLTLSHPRQLDQFTPPPSEGDVSMSVPAVAPAASAGGCGAAGPGTCAQCRADPNSTLFCKSLAASRAQSASDSPAVAGGCCGGRTAGGSCCQSQAPNTNGSVPLPPRNTRSRAAAAVTGKGHSTLPPPAPKAGVTLTCADAYTTLSRHPAYERASADIATWLPKLHASDAHPAMSGRPALEIDAANVMAVLKDFDRRFGQNC